jgi:PPOX class probable F420-dependent enzyme
VEKLGHLHAVRTVLLTSRDASGAATNTPVQLAIIDDDTGYLRTWLGSGLADRLAACPDVRVAPCNVLGKAGGSDQPGVASVAVGVAATSARRALARKSPVLQGLLIPLWYRLRGRTASYFRLIPTAEPTPWL